MTINSKQKKTLTLKTICKLLIVPQFLLSQIALAENLDHYRKLPNNSSAENSEQKKNTESNEFLKSILNHLAVNVQIPNNLSSESLKKYNQNARLSFANSVKQFFDQTASTLLNDENYEKQTTFNPKWSIEKTRNIKKERKSYICQNLIKKFPINEILENLTQQASSANSLKTHLNNEKSVLNDIENSVPSEIIKKIGHAVYFEVTNGYLSEIHFSKKSDSFNDENKISVSLPMLINIKTGSDIHFIDSVGCLFHYFDEQKNYLEIRQEELMNEKTRKRIAYINSYVAKLFEDYSKSEINILENKNKLNKNDFIRYQLYQMADEGNAIAAYLLKKDQYLITSNETDKMQEYSVNQNRIDLLSKILPYLRAKVSGAEFAHKQLSLLTSKELNHLLVFMLRLRGNDFPNSKDLESLRLLSFKKSETSKNEFSQIYADLAFYQVLESSLSNLWMKLNSPKP